MSEDSRAAMTILAEAPSGASLTSYDVSHFLTYARLIDAERVGADWREAASQILLCDVERDFQKTYRCWQSHLIRAHWVVDGPA